MLFKSLAKKELSDNDFLLEKITDKYIKRRIEISLRWYTYNAIKGKICYYFLTLLTIIAPVVSTLLLNLTDTNSPEQIASSIILGISTLAAALLGMFDFQKKWGLYRIQAEKIKQYLALFETNEPEHDLLVKIENSIKSTDEEWLGSLRKQE